MEPELIVDSAMPPSVRSALSSRQMEDEAVDCGGRAGETAVRPRFGGGQVEHGEFSPSACGSSGVG